MDSLDDYLVSREDGLVKLLTPPFDEDDSQPGYIKGYVPGVRENGGQYTHAAVWAIIAFAKLGDGDRAMALYDLIDPIHHTGSYREYRKYKTEPYVMTADVYSVHPHTGQGGWSWYTGAAGWMYQAGIQHILGFQIRGATLVINPCIAVRWKTYGITYRYLDTVYHIRVDNPQGCQSGKVQIAENGQKLPGDRIELVNDKGTHDVVVLMCSDGMSEVKDS
jgi:cellobiose phosphorylase